MHSAIYWYGLVNPGVVYIIVKFLHLDPVVQGLFNIDSQKKLNISKAICLQNVLSLSALVNTISQLAALF